MMKRGIAAAAILVLAVGLTACTRTQKGAGIGAGAGAALGALIGKHSDNTAQGALIGAVVGGAAGTWIGHHMDKQAEEMERDLEGAKIERVGEGIKVTFDSGILFDVNKSDLTPTAQANLDKLATILNKYEDTNILIEGHTDSDGSDEHNQGLSERRAGSVAYYLVGHQVDQTRMSTAGRGESMPVASNDTAEGKQANRRVELAIWANDKLKKYAESQAG